MAIVPFVESGRLVKGMQMLSDELKKETGLSFTGDVPTSYAAVVEAMCVDRVDVGWVSPLAYILAREKCGADMSLVSVTRVRAPNTGASSSRASTRRSRRSRISRGSGSPGSILARRPATCSRAR